MKLFVRDRRTGVSLYLNMVAATRLQLVNLIGSPWFTLYNQSFHVNDVFAESSSNNVASGAVVGGLIGLLGGPIGLLLGGLAGSVLGNEGDKVENAKVSLFNNSRL